VYLSLESFSNISGGKFRNAQLLLVHLQEITPKNKEKTHRKNINCSNTHLVFWLQKRRRKGVLIMHDGQEEKEDWVFELLKSVKKRKR
jgi:hypothetical protein